MKLYAFRESNYERPEWAPLLAITQRTADRADVPTIAVDDFMWMCEMASLDGGAPLHLYKRIDTRRYLNIDSDLRMYAYVPDLDDDDTPMSELVVHYRRLGGLAWAIERLGLGWRRFHDDALHALDPSADHRTPWPSNVTAIRRPRRPGGSVA
jgi:hypothetical protein